MSLRAISVLPRSGQPPEGLFVALHGWGANGRDVAALATFLNLPNYQMIFPDAPFSHPYAPEGFAWYPLPDTYRFESEAAFAQQPELVESRNLLTAWLRSLESITGIPLERTVLAGFSQGGAMTLEVGLQLPLAGRLVLSGYLHSPPKVDLSQSPEVFMVHGRQDLVVPISAARRSHEILTQLGVTVHYQELDMGHEISPTVLELVQNFTEEIRFQPPETA